MKEINILNVVVGEVLSDREFQNLKAFLDTEDSYQKFLGKFLRILIGQDKTITLREFLDLHNISVELSNFLYRKDEIIWEIAELNLTGYTSEIIQWLQQSKNETYLNHINFLNETKAAIKISERGALKKRLSVIDKINAFDLSEHEIKSGIKIAERKRLKNKLNELEKQKNQNIKPSKPFKLRYSTLFLLIIASTFVLAISIPQVRNYIKKQIQELFTKETPAKTMSAKNSYKTFTSSDSLNNIGFTGDSSKCISNNLGAKSSFDSSSIKSSKKYRLYKGKEYNGVTLQSYEKHFKVYKNDLDSIEGIWELDGKFVKYANVIRSKCAIREIENNNFEMVYFDDAGRLWPLHFYYRLVKTENSTKYELQEYVNNKFISKKILSFQKGSVIRFQISMLLSEFNVVTENKSEKVQCNFVGHKKNSKVIMTSN